MKVLGLLLLFTLAISSIAQTTEPPGVSVLSFKWKRHHRAQVFQDDLIRVNDDPFSANDQQKEWVANQKEIARANVARQRGGDTPLPPATRTPNTVADSTQPTLIQTAYPVGAKFEYRYEITISNKGEKKIRRVDWMYLLTDASNREVGTHRFTSVIDLAVGKTKKVSERSLSPPSRVVSATDPNDPDTTHFTESVVIQRIVYEDGSSWQRVPK
jgi:hypothetical protein